MSDSGSSKTDVDEKGDKKEKDKESKKGKGLFARARSLSHLRGPKKEKRLETPAEGSPRRKSTGDGAAMEEDAKEALAKEDKNEGGEGSQEGGEKTKKKKIKKASSSKDLAGSKKNSFESLHKAEKSEGDDDDDGEGADGTESEGVEKTKKSKKRDEGKRSPGGKQRREKSKEKGERRSKGKGEKKEKKEKEKESKGKEKEKKSPETKEKDDESRQIARKIPSLSRMKMTKIASPRDLSVSPDDDDAKLSLDEAPKIVPQARNRSKVHSTKSATITPNNQMRGNDTSRVVRSVALPIDKPLSLNMAIDEGTVRIPLVQSYLRREGKLSTESVTKIFELALEILKGEPNVLMIGAPCCVFGDLHGQFYDLMNLLDLSGTPPNTQCLFLGDYVDRGMFGLETVLYLLSFKINFPKMFWMLRGNHESRQITQNFNFHRECVVKYGEEVYDLCMQVFDAMPLAAVVHADFGNFFCVHGGIGPDVMQLRDIQKIDRFQETPFKGPIASLLWSDPISPEEYPDMTPEDLETFFFRPNEGRGSVGWLFGHRATNTFLSKNNFITLIRGHEVQQFGIAEHYFGVGTSDFPKCITLFSAPNYCEIYNNKAAYLKLLKDSMDYEVVDAVDHPYILPDFMNGISFSLSFVVEIFAALLLHTAHKLFRDDDDEEEVDEEQERKLDEMFKKSKASVEAMKKQREERMQLLSTNISLQKLIKDTPNKSPFEMAVKFDKKVEMTGKPTKNSLRRIKSTPF